MSLPVPTTCCDASDLLAPVRAACYASFLHIFFYNSACSTLDLSAPPCFLSLSEPFQTMSSSPLLRGVRDSCRAFVSQT
eukprot:2190933-Pleurochrysis_carterae.AAC.1